MGLELSLVALLIICLPVLVTTKTTVYSNPVEPITLIIFQLSICIFTNSVFPYLDSQKVMV